MRNCGTDSAQTTEIPLPHSNAAQSPRRSARYVRALIPPAGHSIAASPLYSVHDFTKKSSTILASSGAPVGFGVLLERASRVQAASLKVFPPLQIPPTSPCYFVSPLEWSQTCSALQPSSDLAHSLAVLAMLAA